MGDEFTFFVGPSANQLVDLSKCRSRRATSRARAKEINTSSEEARRNSRGRTRAIGRTTTPFGIDAILNVKGIAGEKGQSITASGVGQMGARSA